MTPTKLNIALSVFSLGLIASTTVAILEQHRMQASRDKALRIDQHCAFMKLQATTLVDGLRSSTPVQRQTAAQGFENLAVNDLRDLKLCVADGANIDPGDRAIQCSRTFDNDNACAIQILETALAHWAP